MALSFTGKTNLSLDERGRIGVPTRYREELRVRSKGQVVVTIPPVASESKNEKRLLIYSVPAWENVNAMLEEKDDGGKRFRYAVRRFLGYAENVELDRNGRVLIPQALRDHAGLEKKVVLAGVGRCFELWAEPVWDEAMRKGDEEHAGAELGFRY